MENLRITQSALNALPDYSCSFPTGTTIGKRWRRAEDGGWVIGEYVASEDPDRVSIKWWQPEITSDPDAVRRPMDLFIERATNWALGVCDPITPEDVAEARAGWAAMLDDWADELTLPYRKVMASRVPR